jgi:hypothetical protein
MPYRINRYDDFVGERLDESFKDWVVAGAIAAASIKAKGQDVLRPEMVRQVLTRNVDTSLKVDFGSDFQSGRFRFDEDSAASIKEKLTRMADFIKEHGKQDILITIEGSESRVPNVDIETGKHLPEGAIATRRVEETRRLITELVKGLGGGFRVSFDTSVRIGGPVFTPSDSARDHKYTDHQYVKVTLKATGVEKSERLLKVCGYKKDLGGGFGDPRNGFKVADTTQTLDLGTGVGKIGFKFDPQAVPDIFLVDYGGKTFMTGLLGQDKSYYRMVYATIIGNYYRDKEKPEWFKNLKYKPISVEEALKIAASDESADVTDFAHVFGAHLSLKRMFSNGSIVPMILEKGQIQAYDDNSPTWAESNWGIIIDKVEGVDKATVTPVGVIGQTRWKLHIDCIGCK